MEMQTDDIRPSLGKLVATWMIAIISLPGMSIFWRYGDNALPLKANCRTLFVNALPWCLKHRILHEQFVEIWEARRTGEEYGLILEPCSSCFKHLNQWYQSLSSLYYGLQCGLAFRGPQPRNKGMRWLWACWGGNSLGWLNTSVNSNNSIFR